MVYRLLFQFQLLTILLLIFYLSPGNGATGTTTGDDQYRLTTNTDRVADGETVCDLKNELVYNLEQLSFFIKADCLQGGSLSNFTNVQECDKCADPCLWPCPKHCCMMNMTSYLEQTKKFNAFYSNHSRQLFCGGKGCADA